MTHYLDEEPIEPKKKTLCLRDIPTARIFGPVWSKTHAQILTDPDALTDVTDHESQGREFISNLAKLQINSWTRPHYAS